MYIAPNTTIKLIRNCPLDPSYENTIFFNSESDQTNYFINTLEGYKLQNNSYQRVNKGTMRVAVNAEHLYTCNYLAFQNASFGSKWFYAFITNIEYINNTTSEVTYELDVIQTWHFNYLLMPCFVEREHSLTDEIGDNIVPEKLDTGDYIVSDYSEPTDLADTDIVLFCTIDDQYHDVWGYWNDQTGMASGLYPVRFPNTSAGLQSMEDWIYGINQARPLVTPEKAIVSICIMPHKLITIASGQSFGHTVARNTTLYRLDGTQIKNNKCLTYPYNFLYVTNYQGKSANYRYEFFEYDSQLPNTIAFDFLGGVCPSPKVLACPLAYKQMDANYDESIELTGYPQVAWSSDAFKAWLAQNASSVGIAGLAASYFGANAIEGAISGGGAHLAKSGAHLAGGARAVGSTLPLIGTLAIASLAISGVAHAAMPPQSHGNMSGAAQFSTGLMTLGFMNKHITPEFATIIDDYFNAYGYATHKIKVPYRTSRPEWNYIKTIGCKIDGGYPGDVTDTTGALTHVTGLPSDDMKKIEEIYNNGITFWHNPAHIGDYTQDNSPTVPN